MNELELREDFIGYRNSFGLVDNTPTREGTNSGNSLLFHAHYVWTMVRRGFWNNLDRSLTLGSVVQCSVLPGLYRRAPAPSPFWSDQEGVDDYIGLASMSAADPNLGYAREILEYGRAQRVPIGPALEASGRTWLAKLFGWIHLRFVYNDRLPGTLLNFKHGMWYEFPADIEYIPNWTAWLGRFPQFVAHLEICARETPPLWRRLWWAASVWQTARFWDKDGTDQWVLSWHLVAAYHAAGKRSWFMDWAARNYTERLFSRFAGGLNPVFGQYFGEGHPLTRWFLS